MVYFEKARVIHMGDLFWNKVIPFIDVAGGGSVLGYLSALDRVLSRVPPDVQVIAGHGEVSDVAGVQAFRKYVAEVVAAAEKAKRAGVSKEKFLEEVDLPAYKGFSGYSDRFKDNCSAAYDEVR